jgi:hypothetical protein
MNYNTHTNLIALDIETAPLPDSLALFDPSFEPDKRLTDPAKIEAALEAKRLDWLADGALKAERGKIIAFGYCVNGGKVFTHLSDDEATLLPLILRVLQDVGDGTLVGHNLTGFDLPFIRRRCWMTGLAFPFAKADKWNPWTFRTFDTMKEWQLGNSRDMVSLDSLARGFGLGGKLGNGKDFAALMRTDKDAARDYLVRDVELSFKVAERMMGR